MTVIEQIINELTDSDKSLTGPLLKTQVLATRIGNEELLNWTTNELNGYSNKEEPAYRISKAHISCTMHQGFNVQENVGLPLMIFVKNKQFIDELLKFRFSDGISALESQQNREGTLGKNFPPDMSAYISKLIEEEGQQFQISDLNTRVDVSQIKQVLGQVRSKLLGFILQIEKEFPDLEEMIKSKLFIKEDLNKKIEQIYHQTIINTSGFGNTITAGQNNTVTSTINITQGNIDDLRRELKGSKVSEEDINEIVELVQVEKPNESTKKFGVKVNSWIQKMISKTLDGTWQIGTGAAGGLLVELIKKFYGF